MLAVYTVTSLRPDRTAAACAALLAGVWIYAGLRRRRPGRRSSPAESRAVGFPLVLWPVRIRGPPDRRADAPAPGRTGGRTGRGASRTRRRARERSARPASVVDTDTPPSLMNTDEDEDAQRDRDEHPHDEPAAPPPAEAAHARRTMIGRSAEEVDHAPPRGRYAPVPAPQASAVGAPLRWAAPAAALAVAGAIVLGRALRRRR
ncbi:hypothetical protein SVIOM342S_05854 [Streptomyces violaceorubidus]